jgi:hypothetical protein
VWQELLNSLRIENRFHTQKKAGATNYPQITPITQIRNLELRTSYLVRFPRSMLAGKNLQSTKHKALSSYLRNRRNLRMVYSGGVVTAVAGFLLLNSVMNARVMSMLSAAYNNGT